MFLGLLLFPSLLWAASPSPVGQWTTVDDVTGKPRSIVRIEEHDGIYDGYIEKVISVEGIVDDPLCVKCEGDKKNQPVAGLKFMWDMKADKDEFNSGKILDPKTGSTYRCSFHLSDGGNKLVVRGYIGISLFGRSQTWIRDTNSSETPPK